MSTPKYNDPFKNLILDEEERLIEQALEKHGFKENSDFEDTRAMFKEAAEQYTQLNSSKPVTIRVNQLDLIKVKARAKAGNIPYQTLLGSLIHQYVEGKDRLSL